MTRPTQRLLYATIVCPLILVAACNSAPTKKTIGTTSATTPTSVATTASPKTDTTATSTTSTTGEDAGQGDGVNETAFGYVQSVQKKGDSFQLTIDYAQLLTGNEAVIAAREDGEIPPDQDYIDDDYYIRNENSKLRTFPIAPDANIVLLLSGDPESTETLTPAEYASSVNDEVGVHITVINGAVTKIEQQYFP